MPTPRFSFIVPVYNAAPYLRECIDSLLAQTVSDLEIVAVNDGSTDDSPAILHEYAVRDSRVRIIDKPNGGVSSARNAALEASTGEWLLFADADDIYMPDTLETMTRIIDASPDVDMVCASSVKFGESAGDEPFVTLNDARFECPIAHISHYALWCYALRGDIVRSHGMRFATDLSHSEDRVFLFEYALYARAYVQTQHIVYRYRRSATQATRSGDGLKIATHELRAARYIHALADRKQDMDQACREALRRHAADTVFIALLHFYSRRHTAATRRALARECRQVPQSLMSQRRIRAIVLERRVKEAVHRLLHR